MPLTWATCLTILGPCGGKQWLLKAEETRGFVPANVE